MLVAADRKFASATPIRGIARTNLVTLLYFCPHRDHPVQCFLTIIVVHGDLRSDTYRQLMAVAHQTLMKNISNHSLS